MSSDTRYSRLADAVYMRVFRRTVILIYCRLRTVGIYDSVHHGGYRSYRLARCLWCIYRYHHRGNATRFWYALWEELLLCLLGTSIGPESFEVNQELANAFYRQWKKITDANGDGWVRYIGDLGMGAWKRHHVCGLSKKICCKVFKGPNLYWCSVNMTDENLAPYRHWTWPKTRAWHYWYARKRWEYTLLVKYYIIYVYRIFICHVTIWDPYEIEESFIKSTTHGCWLAWCGCGVFFFFFLFGVQRIIL